MFNNILLPLDLSDRHGPAVEVAAELTRQSEGEITLLHVIELIPGVRRDEEKTFYRRLEETAETYLKHVARRLSELEVTCQRRVTYGHRVHEVVDQAAALAADLIILTAPQIDARDPTGWGSLSWKIAALCRCPVLLVK